MSKTLDDEWANFISSNYDNNDSSVDIESLDENIEAVVTEKFKNKSNDLCLDVNININEELPECSKIYISTKTKIAYLNQQIDLKNLFWKIPVISYSKPYTGVIKKQMKFNSLCQEELDVIKSNLVGVNCFEEHIITSINNPSGRIKFKDIRKVSIGISKKDITSYRCKKKSAFYNCFVIILRINVDDLFKEFHVKVFNTGKLEIPGIQTDEIFQIILNTVIQTLQPYVSEKLEYKSNTTETVLINSNFNCGYYINREVLFDILKYKYKVQTIYDPCSYPGIQCKFYYDNNTGIKNANELTKEEIKTNKDLVELSFMIFRTGSVLIVGKCDENILYVVYDYLKDIFSKEFKQIGQKVIGLEENKTKKKKIRKKQITIDVDLNSDIYANLNINCNTVVDIDGISDISNDENDVDYDTINGDNSSEIIEL